MLKTIATLFLVTFSSVAIARTVPNDIQIASVFTVNPSPPSPKPPSPSPPAPLNTLTVQYYTEETFNDRFYDDETVINPDNYNAVVINNNGVTVEHGYVSIPSGYIRSSVSFEVRISAISRIMMFACFYDKDGGVIGRSDYKPFEIETRDGNTQTLSMGFVILPNAHKYAILMKGDESHPSRFIVPIPIYNFKYELLTSLPPPPSPPTPHPNNIKVRYEADKYYKHLYNDDNTEYQIDPDRYKMVAIINTGITSDNGYISIPKGYIRSSVSFEVNSLDVIVQIVMSACFYDENYEVIGRSDYNSFVIKTPDGNHDQTLYMEFDIPRDARTYAILVKGDSGVSPITISYVEYELLAV